jgi:hypothetical protein
MKASIQAVSPRSAPWGAIRATPIEWRRPIQARKTVTLEKPSGSDCEEPLGLKHPTLVATPERVSHRRGPCNSFGAFLGSLLKTPDQHIESIAK